MSIDEEPYKHRPLEKEPLFDKEPEAPKPPPKPRAPLVVSAEEVLACAQWARLDPSPEEVEALRQDLSDVLAFARSFDELDFTDVPKTKYGAASPCPLRGDVVEPQRAFSTLLNNSPASQDRFLVVPVVFGGASDNKDKNDGNSADGNRDGSDDNADSNQTAEQAD
ncbi:MAG TPA: aspartyl/glutamyl-tRNA amidotransferase subunit C [Pseudomonadota bacterium]|nr:aspartyl/glutamyl-tRNA amidotransferase subunit C [Pseudomonadota bacterium]